MSVNKPYRIWATVCPFRKDGFPVTGSFGTTVERVIVIPSETWKRMVAEIPGLASAQFEVGEATD